MTTAYSIAQRFVGMKEVLGASSNPAILAMLRLDNAWPSGDDVPWCSAFVNYVAWILRLPRSKDLRARSWLTVGVPLSLRECAPAYDVVILKRGAGEQPGPERIDAPGHVGFFGGMDGEFILVLGGNQGDSVSLARFHADSFLGARRLA